MGKHEKPDEKSILDIACEVQEVVTNLYEKGVLGFYSVGVGIQLASKVFRENFTEYTIEQENDECLLVTAYYNGTRFMACLPKETT